MFSLPKQFASSLQRGLVVLCGVLEPVEEIIFQELVF
jgi:hypothetical protein